MAKKEEIQGAYQLTGGHTSFYDHMMTCSTFLGKIICYFVWNMDREKNRKYIHQALSGIPKNFSGKILEIPVGTGVLTMPKYKKLPGAEITCVDYSFINKTISTQVIGGEAQKTKIKLENAVINSGVSYYSDVKYDFSTFEIINSKLENEGDEILSLANGISITNSTIKNTLKLANVLIENADIDNLVLENKGKDHDSFLVQTSTVDGDKKSQGRITLSNCVVNVDDYFSISVHGSFFAFNSIFFGINNFYSSLENDHLLRIRSDVNLDINIINSNFKNAKVYAIGLSTNKEWENPNYRQTLTIHGSELTGENELRETTLVLNSVLQNATLANASEIKNSFLKEVAKNYEMPTTIEGVNLVANEPKREVGQVSNEIEAL